MAAQFSSCRVAPARMPGWDSSTHHSVASKLDCVIGARLSEPAPAGRPTAGTDRNMFETPAYAQAAGGAAAGSGAFFIQIVPLLLIFVIFWFLLIRPQQKRMRDHQAKLAAVKKGDTVVTGGGLIGKVTKVEDQHVEVELGPQMRVRAVKATLSDVQPLGGSKPAND